MSDTPRTDAETNSHFNRNGPVAIWSDECVLSSFARTLERELSEAKKKYLQVCDQHGRLVDQVYEEDGETLKHISAEARAAALPDDVAERIVAEWYDADESGLQLIRRVEEYKNAQRK